MAKAASPHVQAPFEVATGGIESRLRLSTVRKETPDSIHFREMGSVSGDVGMVHVAISSDIGQYQDTMNKVCKMPGELKKEIIKIMSKDRFHDKKHSKPAKELKGKRFTGDGTGNSTTIPPRDEDKKTSRYYDTVLENLEDECNMLKQEVDDMFLIWFSSFNRPGTVVDDDSVIGKELRSAEYGPDDEDDDDEIDDNDKFMPPRVDRGIETGKGKGTESVSESMKENWRYWLTRKLEGKWPPFYKDMPKYDNGAVKIELWNWIVRKIDRYYDKHDLNGKVNEQAVAGNKTVNTKRKKRKAKKEDLLTRTKRFLFTLFAIAVAAISSIVFTEYEVNRLAETAENNLDSSIAVMEKHESRLNIDEATIENLNNSLKMVMHKVERIAHRLRADELVQEISLIMRQFFGEQRRIVGGLAALSHHRLPPQLINMRGLTTTLAELRNKVERQGMRLGLQKFHDIFGLDCSYAVYKNGTIW